jgi:surface polysaccharide O-acyltransferase-like enzyme
MVWLYNSRIISVFAVVFGHVSAGVVLGSDIGSEYWWFGNIYDSLIRWCIPVFVMISGALLLDPAKNEGLSTFYNKRIYRILLPVLFWSIFFLFLAFLRGSIKGNEPTFMDLFKRLLSGKPHYHMWFLYMILCLYLFTPFFRKIVSNSTKTELIIFVVITFILSAINLIHGKFDSGSSKLFVNWFLSFIPFYFLGYLIREDSHSRSKAMLWAIFFISFISTFTGCYIIAKISNLETGMYFYGSFSISVIPMSISTMYLLKSWWKPIVNVNFTKKLSFLTLGIYLIHPVILEVINYAGYGAMSFHPAISVPVISAIVYAVSLTGAWIIYQVPYLKRTI